MVFPSKISKMDLCKYSGPFKYPVPDFKKIRLYRALSTTGTINMQSGWIQHFIGVFKNFLQAFLRKEVPDEIKSYTTELS